MFSELNVNFGKVVIKEKWVVACVTLPTLSEILKLGVDKDSVHSIFDPESVELNGERVCTVYDLSSCLVEFATIIEDKFHIPLEAILVLIFVCPYLAHDSADVHWLANYAAILLIELLVSKCVWRHWVKKVSNLVVIEQFAENEPALLHIYIVELFSCKWVIDGVVVIVLMAIYLSLSILLIAILVIHLFIILIVHLNVLIVAVIIFVSKRGNVTITVIRVSLFPTFVNLLIGIFIVAHEILVFVILIYLDDSIGHSMTLIQLDHAA